MVHFFLNKCSLFMTLWSAYKWVGIQNEKEKEKKKEGEGYNNIVVAIHLFG